MSSESDAHEALRKVYDEYLRDRYQNDPVQQRHRLLGFDTGHPIPSDEPALNAAREAYSQAAGTGQAINATRDALYAQFDREQIKTKEVDPKRYSTDTEYHKRMDVLIAQTVEEKRQERHQQGQHLQDPQNREQQEVSGDRVADRAAARGKYEQLLQKDSAGQPERVAERAAAREAWEKSLAGEKSTKTIEQDQNRQRNRDIDRGDF